MDFRFVSSFVIRSMVYTGLLVLGMAAASLYHGKPLSAGLPTSDAEWTVVGSVAVALAFLVTIYKRK